MIKVTSVILKSEIAIPTKKRESDKERSLNLRNRMAKDMLDRPERFFHVEMTDIERHFGWSERGPGPGMGVVEYVRAVICFCKIFRAEFPR